MKTSQTDPIRVDFLPSTACSLPGRIGLTFAPGKQDERRGWNRDLEADVGRLTEHFKVTFLISLIEDSELKLLGIEDLFNTVSRRGMRFRRLPIPDGRTPASMSPVIELVRTVLAVAAGGDTVVIHCRGGLGRAGTLAACSLVALGHAPREAISIVRATRTDAIENADQERFVATFAAAWVDAPPVVPSASRFAACLVGGAVGDALGYPVEFLKAPAEIERVLGPSAPERLPGRKGHRGIVSDDTQMTLFTAEGLIRAVARSADHGICSPEAVLFGAYQRWLVTQTRKGAERWQAPSWRGWLLDVPELHAQRAPGNTCLSALTTTSDTQTPPTVERPLNDSKGCGAVMRSAPIGLAARDARTAFDLARDAGVLTHGHPSGYLSAAYFAAVIHGVARDVALPDAMLVADGLLRDVRGAEEVVAMVGRAREVARRGSPTASTIEALGGGWVGEEALAIALLCALTVRDRQPASVAAALWRSVAHAGDSDSTGSLTGNLLGAMFGMDALPTAWVVDVELREVIERLAVDLHSSCVLDIEPDRRRYPPN